jgi:hypothetical protein
MKSQLKRLNASFVSSRNEAHLSRTGIMKAGKKASDSLGIFSSWSKYWNGFDR